MDDRAAIADPETAEAASCSNAPGQTEFLKLIGTRARDIRLRRKMSRRSLSQRCGISERYIALFESGEGNISISLLLRICDGLQVDLVQLLQDDRDCDSELSHLIRLYRSAGEQDRRRALTILECRNPAAGRASRIALIGLRGAGKSTLGRLAARHLGLAFLELNENIEAASGMAIQELFALYGDEGYRRLERQCVEKIADDHDRIILGVAGGIVSEPETYDFLLERFHTVWLAARPDEHMERVRRQGDERPMAGNPYAMEALRNILTSRERHYARAQAKVVTSDATVGESLDLLLRTIATHGFLSNPAA